MEWVKTEWVVPRMGFYFLPEAEGENEVPERPLDGRKVAKYWREMHEERGARKKRRQAAFPGPEAPAHRHASAQEWRYMQKIEVKVLESIMDLFHRLLAPGEKVCAADCAHAEQSMPPEVLKRYLDSLDARLAILRERLRSTLSGQLREDYLDEQAAIQRWRKALVELQAAP